MKVLSTLGIGLIPMVFLSGCFGGSNPSEADARKVFEDEHRMELSEGVVEIVSFKKVNGLARESRGAEVYTLGGFNSESQHGC